MSIERVRPYLAEKGMNIDFTMSDIMDHTNPVTPEVIERSDMVIGPVSGSDISRLLQSFPQSTKVISPLDPKVENLTYSHPNLIQAPTPAKMQYVDMTEWVKEEMAPEDTVLVISEKAFKQSDAAKLMMEVIDSSGIVYNPFSYNQHPNLFQILLLQFFLLNCNSGREVFG